jgi:hypothetical protein
MYFTRIHHHDHFFCRSIFLGLGDSVGLENHGIASPGELRAMPCYKDFDKNPWESADD